MFLFDRPGPYLLGYISAEVDAKSPNIARTGLIEVGKRGSIIAPETKI